MSETLATLPLALPIGSKMRESVERLARGSAPRVTVACSSYLQAAELVRAGTCAAALPDTVAGSLGEGKVHRLALPEKHTLCLAWTARNADTRPALAELIRVLAESMSLEGRTSGDLRSRARSA